MPFLSTQLRPKNVDHLLYILGIMNSMYIKYIFFTHIWWHKLIYKNIMKRNIVYQKRFNEYNFAIKCLMIKWKNKIKYNYHFNTQCYYKYQKIFRKKRTTITVF